MWQVLAVISIGMFMVVLDTTIVNIALPRITTIFGASVDQAQLVLTGYMLALAVIMPTTAYLSLTFGAKRLYLATLVFFTIGSLLCGLAWDLPSLIVARVIQGLGGGMIQPLGMATLFRITPPERRGAVMGMFALPIMVAPILGPTLGGYLVEYVDWRWVFFLNLPFGALALFLGLALMRETPTQTGLRFDLAGFVLAATFSCGALLAMNDAPDAGWSDIGVVVKLWIAAAALVAFIWWELRTPQPLLNLRLFAIPMFSIAALVNFVTTVGLFGAIFLLPLFLQNLRGLGAMETGLLLFPQALASGVSVVLGGRLYDRFGARPLILIGLSILAGSTWALAKIDVTTPDATIRWILIARGLSMGLCMMPANTVWLAVAPPSQTQAASALSNVLRQIFGAAGTAVLASILQERIAYHYAGMASAITPEMPAVARALQLGQQFALAQGTALEQARAMVVGQLAGQVRLAAAVRGFDDAFLIAAVVAVLGLLPALLLRRQPAVGRTAAAPAAD